MRDRKEILNSGASLEVLTLEILLDIRELLKKQTKKKRVTKAKSGA